MIRKILYSLIFICLLFAIVLSVNGVTQVSLGNSFIAFLSNVSNETKNLNIKIPDIPFIPSMSEEADSGFWETMQTILNVLISFINGLVNVLNFLIMVINVIIQLITFIIILIKNFVSFKDAVIEFSTSSSSI